MATSRMMLSLLLFLCSTFITNALPTEPLTTLPPTTLPPTTLTPTTLLPTTLPPTESNLKTTLHYSKNAAMEPEAYMTTVEIIQNRGYPSEAHTVQTKDGYILELHRIPHGLSGPSTNRTPVFLQHGVLFQSGDWVVNFGNQSLGYMLADCGFDVWLGNYRGNTYSKKHIKLDPVADKEKFWDFSFQEHGNYDLPASIDYVLNYTGFNQLSYVGYSMGATGFFILTSNQTEYNSKITKMVALAPVTTLFTFNTYTLITAILNLYQTFLDKMSYYEVMRQCDGLKWFVSIFCNNPAPLVCESIINMIGGLVPDPKQLNSSRIPVIMSHFPAGSSRKTFDHYTQLGFNYGALYAYDYGPIKNLQIYGQLKPPAYDLSKVTVPVAIFSGENDALATITGVAVIAKALHNVVFNYQIEYSKWNHFDFVWGLETERYQNTKVVDFLMSN